MGLPRDRTVGTRLPRGCDSLQRRRESVQPGGRRRLRRGWSQRVPQREAGIRRPLAAGSVRW
eukprot:3393911-Pyramimonas_sp.AAC.1